MTTHYDDEAQAEQLKRWWTENWMSLAAGLVIGLGAIFGWQQYQGHQQERAAEASQIHEDLKKALLAGKSAEATTAADRLIAEFSGTPYAASAALRLAAKAVEDGKLDEAQARLQWVIGHADDDGLVTLARLRQARVVWQLGKPDDALKLLDGEKGGYAALFDELRGDIKLAQGDRKAARDAYEKALQAQGGAAGAVTGPVPGQDALQRKIDDLADQASAVAVQS